VIAISGLSKLYATREGTAVEALKDVNLSVAEGEFVTVVGPSGCGKSTLLKILAGTLRRSSGSVMARGKSLDGPDRDVGVVLQAPVLLPWRTILQNVMVPIEIQRLNAGVYKARALALLKLVGLEGFENKYPAELSGGMQQRVGISRGLVHDPAFLLMDEPFGALDAMTRESMNLELLRIWKESGKTIILVTHSIPEAVFLGDRVAVMSPRPGRITEILTIDIPRPRRLEMINSEKFGAYVSAVRKHFLSIGLDS
jgi:NitT/TauT family transport system ATP-binding protein